MYIENKKIKLIMKKQLVNSILFKNKEILNTTKKWIKKIPILFPAIGEGKEFKINEKIYKIQRHGFWNEIQFNIKEKNEKIIIKGVTNRKDYPFDIKINQNISLDKNKIKISTNFKGDKVPIQFGYHPGFNYDIGNLKYKGKSININKNSTIEIKNLDVKNIKDLDWEKVDTFIWKTKKIVLENEKYFLIVTTNMDYIGIWTNGDNFICIEPWTNLPFEVKKNDNIILNNKPLDMEIEIMERNTNG